MEAMMNLMHLSRTRLGAIIGNYTYRISVAQTFTRCGRWTCAYAVCLFICGCTLHRNRAEGAWSEVEVTPYDTNSMLRATYRIAHIMGYNDFVSRRGAALEKYPESGDAATAERDGYLAGIAAAYDTWHASSITNAAKRKD